MTTYWLVGEKPINNNVQRINVTSDEQPTIPSGQRQASLTQQQLCTSQNSSQGCNPRSLMTGNGGPPGHNLTNNSTCISPSQQRTSETGVSGNSVLQQMHQSDNVPNRADTGPNAPLLLPAGSIPRA